MSATTRLARALLDTPSVTKVKARLNHAPSWWLRCRLSDIDRAALNGRLGGCRHWTATAPGVVALWAPQAVWCPRCATTELHLEGRENYTCDRCSAYADPIEVCTVAGRYAVVVLGLCGSCSPREVGR